ncbi:MAG: TIGR02450 family Trp-rich protein [Methylococcaceae bacterium]
MPKEKHFLVTRLIRDEQEIVVACLLEAVINHREIEFDWHALKDASTWLPGWL